MRSRLLYRIRESISTTDPTFGIFREVVQKFSPQRLLSVVTIEHSSIGSRIQCKTKIMIKEMKIDCPLLKRRE
ncbi:hypothetical protein P8452_12884 [Trifolium repens]|nr:hypothetical protein P8452_12884 [Trifolium repens]